MMSSESNSEKLVAYQKKDGRGHAHPSFFWYDNDKDVKVCFFVTRVTCVMSECVTKSLTECQHSNVTLL